MIFFAKVYGSVMDVIFRLSCQFIIKEH